jgi:hypothetical protein
MLSRAPLLLAVLGSDDNERLLLLSSPKALHFQLSPSMLRLAAPYMRTKPHIGIAFIRITVSIR